MTPHSRLDEANAAREAIGWSWMATQAKLGWSVYHLNQIKTLKRQISDAQLTYLRTVAEAVTAIPVPEPEPAMPENLRVMLLDDIAAKLADAYLAIPPDASRDEAAGARWIIGELAEKMNVADEVKEIVRARGDAEVQIARIVNASLTPRASLDRIPMTE